MFRVGFCFAFLLLLSWFGRAGGQSEHALASPNSIDNSSQRQQTHWAFQPIHSPPIPRVQNCAWIQSPLDAFVLAKLEQRKMHPSPPVDRRTLLRRAYYDLTGLPPSIQEVREFAMDTSPDAFARVVERLLASPRYGERWGRFWLDLARYADTKGYVFEEERRYPFAYTYRDYVIRAFNEDLPYDEFIREQIAADQLPLPDKQPLAALGFLTLGRRFLNNQADIIDDRIDVVSRGLMGLTVACARCHDHKYDPIPQRDYYSLYGVFASCSEPLEKPLLGQTPDSILYQQFLEEHHQRQDALVKFESEAEEKARAEVRRRTGDYLLAVWESRKLTDEKAEALVRQRKLDPGVARRWRARLEQLAQSAPDDSIFAPWLALAKFDETNFVQQAPTVLPKLLAGAIHSRVRDMLARHPPKSIQELSELYGKLFAAADAAWTNSLNKAAQEHSPPPTRLADSEEEALRQVLYAANSPVQIGAPDIFRLFDVPTAQKARRLRRELEELDATHPGAPARGMVLQDNPEPFQAHVFLRGNPNNAGPAVPRQFLELIAGPNRHAFQHGSGRLELAEAIASPANPLTARVLVNRLWLHHFGAGLVRTPSDFGTRSEPPTHPELLDFLASKFIADGWSIKKLHRVLMLSSAYQQSAENNSEFASQDPNNLWLWRMNRQRLDFEELRDTVLEVAGTINLKSGGHSLEITSEPFSTRRTVYGFIDRQNLPAVFRTFDFASPDTTSPKRFTTTVPQQALFVLNSPFVIEEARQLVRQLNRTCQHGSDADRICQLYRWAYQRDPNLDEIDLALHFVTQQEKVLAPIPPPPVWQYGYGNFDPSSGKRTEFHPFAYFTGNAWHQGDKLPDPATSEAVLTAEGGHPGKDLKHSVFRRWIAPVSGVFKISGAIVHESTQGDGVRAHIVSSNRGEIASAIAQHSKSTLELDGVRILKGEIIDFIAECRDSADSDAFKWAPTVRLIEKTGADDVPVELWDARADFHGPVQFEPLSPWEKYAQVLLMSSELAFVD